ncbi:MAG: hypothetical protein J6H20_04540 [Pyramidobacter sp.]|nr:hypothetical protein [Pyramidobacter sp.]MBP3836508.1 hypothetical protein [Pyramidobacter sp.]
MRDYKAAVRLLELLLRFHPCGLGVILGTYPPPDAEAWDEMLALSRPSCEYVRVGHSPTHDKMLESLVRTDELDTLVTEMGGWDGIKSAALSTRIEYPVWWTHFVKYLDRVDGARGNYNSSDEGAPRTLLAAELGIDAQTLTEHRYKIPAIIARKAMNGFQKALL